MAMVNRNPEAMANDATDIRPSSMAQAPSLMEAGGELYDTMDQGFRKTVGDYSRGIQKIGTNIAAPLVSGLGSITGSDTSLLDTYLGKVRSRLATEQAAADAQFAPYEEASPIASNLPGFALEAALPATKTLKGAMALGAGIGGLKYSDNQAIGAVTGAIGGGAGQGIGSLANKLMGSGIPMQQGARELLDMGVPLTTGQRIGGRIKDAEDMATSIPGLGSMIESRRNDSIQAYSPAVVRKVLKDSGMDLPPNVRLNGMDEGNSIISDAYDKVLDFDTDLPQPNIDYLKSSALARGERKLTDVEQKKLSYIVGDVFDNHIGAGGPVAGQTLKKLDSKLRFEESRFSKSGDPLLQDLGSEIGAFREEVMDHATRNIPGKKDAIRNLDLAFAKMRTLDRAGGTVGAKEGMFTPAQHKRALTTHLGPRRAAERKDTDLLFSDNAQDIIGSSVNNSGTAERLLTAGSTGGLAYSLVNGSMPPLAAAAAVPMVGGAVGGTKAGQAMLNALLFSRPSNTFTRGLEAANIPGRIGAVAGARGASDEELIRQLEEDMGLLP
ncbi:MAG: hypothetical protein JRD04_11955 [Deltaproteobacteria bacterium]|nr:hypothetical protein [Deltaproteobacteria bacterium]